jgi:hypothetical protein
MGTAFIYVECEHKDTISTPLIEHLEELLQVSIVPWLLIA